MTQQHIRGTHEVFRVPKGSVLIVTPASESSAGRVTANTSGAGGPWTAVGGTPTTIGPFAKFVELTVESAAGSVYAEVTSAAALSAAQAAALAAGGSVAVLNAAGTALVKGDGTTQSLTQIAASVLTAMTGLPAASHYYPLDDTPTATQLFKNLKSYGAAGLSTNQSGYGVMAGGSPIVQGNPQETCAVISHRSRPVAEGANVNDNTGAVSACHFAVVMPMVTRSGPAQFYQIITKRATTSGPTNPGYAFGLYWTGTKTVMRCDWYGATATNFASVIGTTDILNFTAAHLAFQNTGAKTAAAQELYLNGALEAMTTLSDTLGADTCANSGNYAVGGVGGSQTVATNQGFSGCVYAVTPYHSQRFTPQAVYAHYLASAVGKVQPKTAGGAATPMLIWADVTTDIDDVTAISMALAAHLRGEIAIKGIVINSSQTQAAPLIEAVCVQAGIAVPIAAYKGNDRDSTGAYQSPTCTQFGITKTAASYADPLTLARTVLAQNSGVIVVQIGPQNEMQTLMNSGADGISPLTGKQLVQSKTALTVIMGGYSSGASAEYNFAQAKAAAADVAANWPTPITYAPYEIGTGTNAAIPGNSDVTVARTAFEAFSLITVGNVEPNYYRTTSYDAVAMLFALKGLAGGSLALSHTNATQTVNPGTGANTWGADNSGNRSCLSIAAAATVQVQIEQYVAESVCAGRQTWALS